jgi:hypothetical protein
VAYPLKCVFTERQPDGSTMRCAQLAYGNYSEQDGQGRPFLLPLCQEHGWQSLVGRLVRRREAAK